MEHNKGTDLFSEVGGNPIMTGGNPGHNKPKLGSGKRFAVIEAKAKKYGAKNPAAVAAAAGIKKYGQKKMTKMAQAGKRRKKS